MRRLGQELGRDPMALYRHAKNRAALLDAVTELVLRQLIVPTLVTAEHLLEGYDASPG